MTRYVFIDLSGTLPVSRTGDNGDVAQGSSN